MSPDLSRRRFGLLVGLEALLATALGWYRLDAKSIWYDEGVTAMVSALAPHRIVEIGYGREPNMVGYHLVLWAWRGFGDGEVALRSLSVVATVATVVALAFLGRRLHGPAAGLVAGLVLAVAPFAHRYAREARSYALVMFLVTAGTWCFVALVEDRRRWPVVAYPVVMALAAYAHLFALLVVLAHGVSLTLAARPQLAVRRLVVAAATLALLLVPLATFVVLGPDRVDWIPTPRIADLVHVASEIGGGDAITVVLGVGLLLRARRVFDVARLRGRSSELWREGLGLAWAAVPFVVAFAIAVTVKPLFLPRYLIVCLPAVALVAGAELARVRPRALVAVALAVVVVLSIGRTVAIARDPSQQDWRAAVAIVRERGTATDGVVACAPESRAPVEYYVLRLAAAKRPVPVSPAGSWTPGLRDRPAPDARIVAGPDRIWVLTDVLDPCVRDIGALLVDDGRTRTLRVGLDGVRVERFDR